MIQLIDSGSSDQLEVRFSGLVTASDYESVLVPAIEEALRENDHVRMLAVLDEDVSYDVGGAWSDLKLGLSHWRGFDRIAVVAGRGWMRSAMGAFAPLAPCPVQMFDPSESDTARRWLRESLGAMHIRDLGGNAFQLQLLGKLDPASYANTAADLDARTRGLDRFCLLLDLREFDGWEGISALSAHLGFARAHAPMVQKLALVGNSAWQRLAERIGGTFLEAETRFFEGADFEAAKDWLTKQ
ncbi:MULTISPECIES: STAS/SEC14 domain-containing protein [Falsihalocynthiibacter]|uniref:STAS/SEC14 domain-containing protein n=1 Tax=Falsihalocynthiibacter TaxID=2854182 RepID=UPI003002361B